MDSNSPDAPGELFSRVYLRSPTVQRDRARFRRRLHAWFAENMSGDYDRAALLKLIEMELGVELPFSGYGGGVVWGSYFKDSELRDVLDTITLMHRVLAHNRPAQTTTLRAFVAKVFKEESLGYAVDEHGGILYAIDAEYERNRFSVVDGLGEARYAAVKNAVETAFKRLDGHPDTKAAVREMFEAVEILAKLMASTNEDLDERMVKTKVKPIAQSTISAQNRSAISFSDQMLESLGKWVNAGHRYRHGQQTEEPVAPNLDSAVAFLSLGASYIRYLVSVDTMNRILR